MNFRSFKRVVLSAGVGVAACFALSGSAMAQEVTLRFHQFLPAHAHVPKNILAVWIENVEKDSGGRIKIEHFPSMQLGGKPSELIDQVSEGVVDIIWTVIGYTPGRYPRTEAFELPFLMSDTESFSRAFYEFVDTEMRDEEFKDLHVLGAWVHDPGLFHSKTPVREIADLKGMKIRGASRTVNMLLEELGAIPVGLPVPAVPESLSKGVIDGASLPWGVVAGLKVPELVHNHTEFTGNALFTATFLFAMNKDRYDSLPDDLKQVIDKNSDIEFSAFAGKVQEDITVPTREAARAMGNTVIQLDAATTAEWRKAAQPVYDKWAKDMDDKGYDGKGLIAKAEALAAKYAAGN